MLLGKRRSKNAPLFVWQDGSVVNRAEFVDRLRLFVGNFGLDPATYSDHSLKRGGATPRAAAAVPDQRFVPWEDGKP